MQATDLIRKGINFMASKSRRILYLPFLYPPPCGSHIRPFSTSRKLLKNEVKVRERPQKSFKVLLKQQEQGGGSNLPNDLGLLEGLSQLSICMRISEGPGLKLQSRHLYHADRPSETIHFHTPSSADEARMAQAEDPFRRVQRRAWLQVYEQVQAPAEAGSASRWTHRPGDVQADVYCFRGVRARHQAVISWV